MSCGTKSTGPAGAAPRSDTDATTAGSIAARTSSFDFMPRIIARRLPRRHEDTKKHDGFLVQRLLRAFVSSWAPSGRGELAEGVAGDAEDRPRIHRLGAEFLVEADRRLVPVEHRPLEAAAAALDGESGQMHEQCLAVAAPAELRHDEEILEVQARPGEERRVVVEEEREARRLVA